jgi:hypothetical protein
VLVCACGFVADHLEVLYDLDIEAPHAPRGGLAFARTACVNDDRVVMARSRSVSSRRREPSHVAVVGGGHRRLSAALALLEDDAAAALAAHAVVRVRGAGPRRRQDPHDPVRGLAGGRRGRRRVPRARAPRTTSRGASGSRIV